ncbi:MAG: hypothetical protein ACJAT2_003258 [Bacteriovoracaceae bacterium]|jgi:hypothetical protein
MGIFTFIFRMKCMPAEAGAESRRRKYLRWNGRIVSKAGAEATEESIKNATEVSTLPPNKKIC